MKVPRTEGPCRANGCERRASSNGLCVPHAREARQGLPLSPVAQRRSGRRGPKRPKPIERPDGAVEVPLVVSGKVVGWTVVDGKEATLVIGRRWTIDTRPTTAYAREALPHARYGVYLHRVLMGEPPTPGLTVDHRNRNGLDNRRRNLRWATPHEQRLNQRRNAD